MVKDYMQAEIQEIWQVASFLLVDIFMITQMGHTSLLWREYPKPEV